MEGANRKKNVKRWNDFSVPSKSIVAIGIIAGIIASVLLTIFGFFFMKSLNNRLEQLVNNSLAIQNMFGNNNFAVQNMQGGFINAGIMTYYGSVMSPGGIFPWGPERPLYTVERPADTIVFNSITNNPNIGDERNFVGIREAGTNDPWTDSMIVQDGKQYSVRMYIHNNAADNLSLVAHDVTAMFNLPTTTSTSINVNGFLTSSNASPTQVYDSATFTSSKNFNLSYVSESLLYANNIFGPNGIALSESIFTSDGTKLGYDALDGNIPGCFQYAGYISFTVRPQFEQVSDFSAEKYVSKHGDNNWVKSYVAKAGEIVDYMIVYKNTGEIQHDGVTVRDTLPAGMTYVNGSTILGNSVTPNGTKLSDNIANRTGINIGSYATGANAWIVFSAEVTNADQLADCGVNRLVNSTSVTTGGYSIGDSADIIVVKKCD